MLLLSIPKSLNVLTITNKAKVESRPPEIPITAFFKWVTQSVSMSSQKVDSNQGDAVIGDLPPPPPEINFVF